MTNVMISIHYFAAVTYSHPIKSAYGVYIYQLIYDARVCSLFTHLIIHVTCVLLTQNTRQR